MKRLYIIKLMLYPIVVMILLAITWYAGRCSAWPVYRWVSKDVVNLIKKFESEDGQGILLVIFTKDGKQHFYYTKNMTEPIEWNEPFEVKGE